MLGLFPPFPVIGRTPSATVTDRIKGYIELKENGVYSSMVINKSGELKCSLRLTPEDYHRWNEYRHRLRRRSLQRIFYHAGFVTFDSISSLTNKFPQRTHPNFIKDRINTIRLAYPLEGYPIFDLAQPPKWQIETLYRYDINSVQQTYELPIQLVPNIVNEGEPQNPKTALEITVQINREFWPESLLDFPPIIKSLKLNIPRELGKGEVFDPSPASLPAQNDGSPIEWSDIKLRLFEKKYPHSWHRVFYVRFARPLVSDIKFNGSITLSLAGSLSGIDNVAFYYPTGHKRDELCNIEKRTNAEIEFSLALKPLRNRRRYFDSRPIAKLGVVPDHKLINDLVRKLNGSKTYVQRVIENPPQTSFAHAAFQNRFWDIGGRTYDGIYPIDFHILIYGREEYRADDKPINGNVTFEISAHATIINDGMKGKVDEFLNSIEEKINESVSDVRPQRS